MRNFSQDSLHTLILPKVTTDLLLTCRNLFRLFEKAKEISAHGLFEKYLYQKNKSPSHSVSATNSQHHNTTLRTVHSPKRPSDMPLKNLAKFVIKNTI